MAYADSIRTTDYTREELASLIEDVVTSTGPAVFASWTPTIAASGGTYTGVSTVWSEYMQIGKMIFFRLRFSGTSTSLTGVTFTLPVTGSSNVPGIPANALYVEGSKTTVGLGQIASTTQGSVAASPTTSNLPDHASLDIRVSGFYEAA